MALLVTTFCFIWFFNHLSNPFICFITSHWQQVWFSTVNWNKWAAAKSTPLGFQNKRNLSLKPSCSAVLCKLLRNVPETSRPWLLQNWGWGWPVQKWHLCLTPICLSCVNRENLWCYVSSSPENLSKLNTWDQIHT